MIDRIHVARAACCAAVFLLVCHNAGLAWSQPKDPKPPAATAPHADAKKNLKAATCKTSAKTAAQRREAAKPSAAPDADADATPRPEPTLHEPIQSRPVHAGFVILEGRYLTPPYTVQWVEDGLRVNGIPVPFENRVVPARRAKTPLPPHRTPWRMVASLEHQLRSNVLLLGLDHETAVVMTPRDAVRIVETLVGEQPAEAKVEALVAAGYSQFSSGQWSNVVERFEPTAEVVQRVAAVKVALEANKNETVAATTASPAITASVLTALSIALTVFALGTLLTHRPNARQGWRGCNPSRTGCRLVIRCVLLLLLLNAFDLACTLMAVQAGGFWELNPVAERLISSVGHMILFKTTLIAAGAAILLAFRRYRFTQHAAWWVCVFHMVLMLRWATYNSLFLT